MPYWKLIKEVDADTYLALCRFGYWLHEMTEFRKEAMSYPWRKSEIIDRARVKALKWGL